MMWSQQEKEAGATQAEPVPRGCTENAQTGLNTEIIPFLEVEVNDDFDQSTEISDFS